MNVNSYEWSPLKKVIVSSPLTHIVQTLKKHNVTIHRPLSPGKMLDFKIPSWDSSCIPSLNVRDQVIIIGNEIIETPPQIRTAPADA